MSLLRLVEDTQSSLRDLTKSSSEVVAKISNISQDEDGMDEDVGYFIEPIEVQRSRSQDELDGIPIVDISELKVHDGNENLLQDMCERAIDEMKKMEASQTSSVIQLQDVKKELLRTISQRDSIQIELKKVKEAFIENEAETLHILQDRELELERLSAELNCLNEEMELSRDQLRELQETAELAVADMDSALCENNDKHLKHIALISEENMKLNQKVIRLTELVCFVVEEINTTGSMEENLVTKKITEFSDSN